MATMPTTEAGSSRTSTPTSAAASTWCRLQREVVAQQRSEPQGWRAASALQGRSELRRGSPDHVAAQRNEHQHDQHLSPRTRRISAKSAFGMQTEVRGRRTHRGHGVEAETEEELGARQRGVGEEVAVPSENLRQTAQRAHEDESVSRKVCTVWPLRGWSMEDTESSRTRKGAHTTNTRLPTSLAAVLRPRSTAISARRAGVSSPHRNRAFG